MLKKLVSVISVLALLSMPISIASTAQAAEQASLPKSRMANVNQELYLPIGMSYTYMFDLQADTILGHDTFHVILSNMSGKYKYIVLSADGSFVRESKELTTDDGYTFAISVNPADVFKVVVINTGASTLTGNVRIESYYHGYN